MSSLVEGLHRQLGLTDDELERILKVLGREPSRAELAMYSLMWSEHCSYKSSKVHLRRLPSAGARVLQGPGENAGVVDLGDGVAAVFKIESHNHPSFVEPFQGAATGVGGIIRDILAMGARPAASLNSLRFGDPAEPLQRRLVEGVVAGIGHYGNCVGVATVGGEVVFDPCYAGNPLVNALTVGFMPADRRLSGSAERPVWVSGRVAAVLRDAKTFGPPRGTPTGLLDQPLLHLMFSCWIGPDPDDMERTTPFETTLFPADLKAPIVLLLKERPAGWPG